MSSMSSPDRYRFGHGRQTTRIESKTVGTKMMGPIDQELRHRLRNWAAGQPLPKNGRERLIKAALLSTLSIKKPVTNHFVLNHGAKFNWTATYLAGDRLLNLRLVS